MIKPNSLKKGDRIAALSLSSGMAGDKDILWRYEQGKKQLEEMGFKVVEYPLTLAGSDIVYHNPKKRADDFHQALLDKRIKGIIATIGGIESYRLFEFVDLEVIKNNPKIFIGYSDATSVHQMFQQAGVVSFYGPAILTDFAENGGVFDFTREVFEEVLIKNNANYTYPHRKEWTSEFLAWDFSNKDKRRKLQVNEELIVLQGSQKISGKLMGGCLEVLSMLRGTELYPKKELFQEAILLLETSELTPEPSFVEIELRTMGVMGNLQLINGIVFGKPMDNKYFDEYQEVILKVLKEFNLKNLPVFYSASFGHTEPKWTLPLGVLAEMDLENKTLKILEKATKN